MVSGGNKAPVNFAVGDEVSYATGAKMIYGEVVRLLEGGAAVEILFEDGRREVKKARDRSVRLLRRAAGASEAEEQRGERRRGFDSEISEVMRRDQKRR
jgi:hypothetical protein